MQEAKFTKEEAQAIANYLITRPYHEVFQLIALLQSKFTEDKKDEKKEDQGC